MQKILILTFYFPPCNLTASYRVKSWAEHMNECGFYPVIVTRRWDINVTHISDISAPTENKMIHEKNENYEVYYLPYHQNLRDRIYYKFKDNRFVKIRKLLSLFEISLQNGFNFVNPFKNIYSFSKKLIEKDRDIKIMLTSGSPFILFRFCYLLNKKYGIPWIADYRDEWNSTYWEKKVGFPRNVIRKIEFNCEKKWLKTVAFATATTKLSAETISEFIERPAGVIYNGYVEEDFNNNTGIDENKEFTFVYNGTLYDYQQVEVFSEGYKKIIDEYKNKLKIKIIFAGLGLNKKQKDRVELLLKGYEDNYIITGRLLKKEIIEIQLRSHVLLHIAIAERKGVIASKIFEYIACRKTILFCPSDKGEVEGLLKPTNLALFCSTEVECYDIIKKLVDEYIETGKIKVSPNEEVIKSYTRKIQTQHLAEMIKKTLA
ncbi:MAG: glycosyltransferase family 4 protein [Bacteroidetes bacterium]|nr:glycosyltransferase family 4 protein [Bacteroidota bacterium]